MRGWVLACPSLLRRLNAGVTYRVTYVSGVRRWRAYQPLDGRMQETRSSVGVALRHAVRGVPEQVTDRRRVRASHSKTRCERVPQVLPPEVFDASALERGSENPAVEFAVE
jgi:hypothetical protein